METVFRIKVNELNASFIKTIKTLFKKDGEVEITIHAADDKDETSYLLSTQANRKALEKSIAEMKAGKVKELKFEKMK